MKPLLALVLYATLINPTLYAAEPAHPLEQVRYHATPKGKIEFVEDMPQEKQLEVAKEYTNLLKDLM
ncbi:MAG: hypothetical protein AABZ55_03100, partial [Bdellovibrionota bacterium]